MMNKLVKYCVTCNWSQEHKDYHELRCMHPLVNSKDSWSLADTQIRGTNCRAERDRGWLDWPACGKAGKLWEAK